MLTQRRISNNTDSILYIIFNNLSPSDLADNIESIVGKYRKMPLFSKGVVAITAFLSVLYNSKVLDDDKTLQGQLELQLQNFLRSDSNSALFSIHDFCNELQIRICISDEFNFDLFEYLEGSTENIKSYLRKIDDEKIPTVFYNTFKMYNIIPRDNSNQLNALKSCPNCEYVDYEYGVDGLEVAKNMISPLRLVYATVTHSILPLVTGAIWGAYQAIKHSNIATPLLRCKKCNMFITICSSCDNYISHSFIHPNFRPLYTCTVCKNDYKICGRSNKMDNILLEN